MSSEKHQQDASAEAVSTLERLISRASKKTRDEFIHKKSEIISAAYQRKLNETENKASGIRTSEHPVPIRPWTDELLELIAAYGCKAMKEVASKLGQQFGRWWASAFAGHDGTNARFPLEGPARRAGRRLRILRGGDEWPSNPVSYRRQRGSLRGVPAP